LAAANEYDKSVSILLGKGDGTFQAHVDYAAGASPTSLAVGDFNGDGKADLVVANYIGGSVSVLLGNGDGTFQGYADFTVGNSPDGVAIGDFDGDGKTDLAVAYEFGNSVSILLGNGDGSFQTPVNYMIGYSSQYRNWVGVGDFNCDSEPDLAVVNTSDYSVSVLLGNGNGTFQAHADYAKGQVFHTAIIADFNGDGASDLGFLLPLDAAGDILNLNLRCTALELQSSQSSVLFGQSVTFTATIHAGTNGVSFPSPTGTIKFIDGTNQLSIQTLGVDGVVRFATSALTPGTHNISAVYSGDANFNPHTVSLVEIVNGPDFAINATPGSATLKSGGSAAFSVAVAPMYGFNGSVSLTCSVSPTSA
jgi:Bacterial Ig-like domain (group 3)/FG-GAP-like repeat